MDEVQDFGWKRKKEYIKVNFYIMWKKLLEYKNNMYFSAFEHYFFILTYFAFYFLIFDNFGEGLGWELYDYFVFFIFCEVLYIIAGTFMWGPSISEHILKGKLSDHLRRPFNPFFSFFFQEMNFYGLFLLIQDVVIYSVILFFLPIEFYNVGFSILIMVLIILLILLEFYFVKSLDLIMLNLSLVVIKPFWSFYELTRQYPYGFFRNSGFRFVLLGFPFFLIGSLLIPLLRGYEVWNPLLQISVMIVLIFVFSFGIFFCWHYGLKKYEAFG